jgi:hypothetical protein
LIINSTATVNGATALNGNLNVTGTSNLVGATTIHAPMVGAGLGLGGLAIAMPAFYEQIGWLEISAGGGGTIAWSAGKLPVGGFIPFVARANASGTPDSTSNPVQFNFAIAADTVNALGTTGGFLGLNLSHNFGGAATSGTHHAARFNILHNGTVDVSVGGGFQSSLQAWYTGSSTFTTGLGAAFAFNPQVILTSAASNYALLEAIEGVATSFMLGTPPTTRAVLAAFTGGTQQASNDDDGINFSGVAGEVGFMSGIRYGRFGTVWPIDPAGSLIMARTQANATGYLPPTAAYGMRFGNVNFTAGVLKSPGLLIDGAGTVNVGAGKIAKIATGMSIDVTNYTGGSPTISAAGASYQVNDQLTGTGTATLNGGIYIVDTVSGGGNILTGHFLAGREPVSYGGAGPATIAMEGGHGNQLAVIGVTWTQQRALQIQPTAGGSTTVGGTFDVPAGYQQNGTTVFTTRGTGQQSTLVGLNAGALLPSNDTETTAVGWNALAACTGATLENTAVGWGSLRSLTTGFFNTAVGVNTGGLIITDTDNVLLGTDVMRDSTGGHNVAVGNGALRDGNHTQNVAIGHLAMTANGATTATTSNNVAIGYQVMISGAMTTAANNVMIGFTAGQVITTAANNTGVGSGALNRLTTGIFNATVGRNSLVAVTTGFNNAALGVNAGAALTTGQSNLILGPMVGSTTLATGAGNILIGVTAAIDTPGAADSHTFALGDHATNLMRATGINTATPAFFLDWIPGSTTFANDAAAAIGGVLVGQIYRNGSALQCRII